MLQRMMWLLCVAALLNTAAAQTCEDEWVPSGEFLHELNGNVNAMTWWDPDGEGPRSPVIVVGGRFTQAGPTPASHIAMFDPSTGELSSLGIGVFSLDPFGSGYTGEVQCLLVAPSGNLIVGGNFDYADGLPAHKVAEWNGFDWTPMAGGMDGTVYALTCNAAGEIFAGGVFQSAGSVSASNIAKWNGASWSALNTGMSAGVFALAIDSSDALIAGGGFVTAGGVGAARIARWDGSMWSPFGVGFNTGNVRSILIRTDGELIAGGDFSASGETLINRIARWDGSSWNAIGNGVSGGSVRVLVDLGGGEILAGGTFLFASGNTVNRVARWDGVAWQPVGNGLGGTVRTAEVDQAGRLFVAGEFVDIGPYIALWDHHAWISPFPYRGLERDVVAIGSLPAGQFIAAAESLEAVRPVVRWNGATWTTVTSIRPVFAIATKPNGDFVIGGNFGGRIRANVGGAWKSLGSGLNGPVYAVMFASNGDIIAAGDFTTAGGMPARRIARWNGTAWSPLGLGIDNNSFNGHVNTLAEMPNGDIVAGGVFANAGGGSAQSIARWNGTAWHPLAEGLDGPAYAMAVLKSGELVVGGTFSVAGSVSASNIARWNGESWTALAEGVENSVRALAVLPNGDLVAGGLFTEAGNGEANYIARWDGLGWSPIAAGIDSFVFALATLTDGSLAIGGDFEYADNDLSRHWAIWRQAWGPVLNAQPRDASTCTGGSASFSAGAEGSGDLSYRWQWKPSSEAGWSDLSDGVNAHMSRPAVEVTASSTSEVSIHVLWGVGGDIGVRCVVSNECSESATLPASLLVCLADLDCSSLVDDADFVVFVGSYDVLDCQDAAMPSGCPSDFNGDGVVDDADFIFFVGAYNRLLCP